MGFGEGATKVVFVSEGFAEGADVCGAEGEEGEKEPGAESGEVEAPGESKSDENEGVGEAVGGFVEKGSGASGFVVLDGNEAVEEVADTAGKDGDDSPN